METSPPLARLASYRLLEKLGTGAMGTVYLAEDEDENHRVALKVLHPHLLERKGFFKRFQREARAGGQVDHPNVVRTLDCDFQMVEGTPQCFLIMEYVEGRTLRALLQELGQVPEALLRELARQVAAGLEAIHSEGIVHRDLKPENGLVTRDHQVRIMDLGIAKLHEASVAITKEGQFAGSLLYASPEQIRHQQVGPASDLYALGVVMYELATGVSPFRGDDAGAVVHAHLEEAPPRASELAPELSTFFTEVVSTLLAKDADERFGSARDLYAVLEDGERSPWWTRQARALRARERRLPRIPLRRETKLYGRETELELLRQSWERAKDGQGNTLLIEGEAGIGKTRLVDAFIRDLDGQAAHVLYGSYPPAGGMGAISDAILGRFGSEGLEDALKPYLRVTPSLVSPFADVLKHETPPLDAPSLAGDALHAVIVHLMRALAAEQPLLWIVEDLHFADTDSRKVLLSLARAVEGHRVMLLATTRPGLSEEDLAHLSRLESFRRAGLGRLSAREVILLLQDAFRSEALAEKLGGKIALKSDGVPFFVFEMIRGLREGQFIEQLPDGSYVESKVVEEIEVPSAVKDLIEARLKDLSDEERAVLDVGAVQGFEFDADLVAAARRMERVFVLEQLASIERRSGVVRAAGPRYRFDHHQIQEVLYSQLSEGLSEEYHSLLAKSLAVRERVAGRDPEELPGETAHLLAWHRLRSRDPQEGLAFLKPALDHLERSYRNEAAIKLAAKALALPGLLEGKERLEVLLNKAERHDLRGERELERATLDEALALSDEIGDPSLRAKTRVSRAHYLSGTSAYEAGREELEQALALAREAKDKELEGEATGNLGDVLLNQGRY
ncbi:MAG: serine/threonine-protein kinase, partial [Planctomycetota bacterium]